MDHPARPNVASSALRRLCEHPDAPIWNHRASDRLRDADRIKVFEFAERLAGGGVGLDVVDPVPDWLLAKVEHWQRMVPIFRQRIPRGFHLARDWQSIPTSGRMDLAVSPDQLVPDDTDLSEMLIYRTAGTTGEALHVPHHARAVASYCPLLTQAMRRWDVEAEFSAEQIACVLLGAQRHTVTYATTLSVWHDAGFAKLNLDPGGWPHPGSANRYLRDIAPQLLTGDPQAFTELLLKEIAISPRALFTTAVAMNPHLRTRLGSRFAAPVIDWYSLTETGPLGYVCRENAGFHLLCPDVAVEVLGPDGLRVESGQRGEVAVSGGRNPYVPLLRYRTGDWGRLSFAPCACGDPSPRLVDLEGRAPVRLLASDGSAVNTVDVSRVLREFPILKQQLTQLADRSVQLVFRPLPDAVIDEAALRVALAGLFGRLSLSLRCDLSLGSLQANDKVLPYRSELLDD